MMNESKIAARDAERRRVILDAALGCFLQFGYAKTSLEDIAQRAGLSRPLLYQKYANKDAILAAAYEHVYAALYPRAHAVLGERLGNRDKLARVCEIMVLEPWTILCDAPMAADFQSACDSVAPDTAEQHARRWLAIVQPLVGDRLAAEVFIRAIDGLCADAPKHATLRRRLAVLIERFAA